MNETDESTKFTREWMSDFISHLRSTGRVSGAAAESGVPRSTAYDSRKADEAFAAAWADAVRDARLERAEEWRDLLGDRIRNGVVETRVECVRDRETGEVVDGKERVIMNTRMPDALLTLALKADDPECFSADGMKRRLDRLEDEVSRQRSRVIRVEEIAADG